MAAKAKPKSKARPKPQLKLRKKPATHSKGKPKKPVKPQRSPSTKAKSKNTKVGPKSQAKRKPKATTQATPGSKTTPKKAVRGKEKKLTKKRKIEKPKTANSTKSAGTKTKPVKTADSKPKAPRSKIGTDANIPGAQPAPGGVKRGPGRPKKEQTAAKGPDEKRAKDKRFVPPAGIEEKALGEETSNLEMKEKSLPEDIDEELDIEVETDEDITLDALTTEIDDATDAIDVDDLTDDFDEDDFAEDLADEGDEDLDLTEDLSEELGPEKYFRETETHVEDDEEEIPRSW